MAFDLRQRLTVITVSLVRVVRSRDRRWRLELHDNGLVDMFEAGHLVLRRATMERVAQMLAQRGVSSDELVED